MRLSGPKPAESAVGKPAESAVGRLIDSALRKRDSNDLTGATADLKQALSLKPDSTTAAHIYSDLAYCAKLSGNWDVAIDNVTDSLAADDALDPTRLYADRAYAYMRIRRPDGALADYERVLDLNSNDPTASTEVKDLTALLKSNGRGAPAFFVFGNPSRSLPETPTAILRLQPRTFPFLNMRGWGESIPRNELRYTARADELVAVDVAGKLRSGGINVGLPVYEKPPALAPSGPIAVNRIELWLAYP